MNTTMDYIDWRGDLSFDISPFNEMDCFLCSQLSSPDYTGIADKESVTVEKASEEYFKFHTEDKSTLGVLQSEHVLPMLKKLAESERFKDIIIEGYENKIDEANEEQFCAATLLIPDGTMVISYRGTDDTIVGWNEDFNIAIHDAVPAQVDAVDYLIRHASGFCGDIILTGHSKGGNLAVYAAANAPENIKPRISSVISFDGPGFKKEFLESEEYKSVESRITTILPQHSLVGVIMNLAGEEVIVDSTVSGPLSHDGFHWKVTREGFKRENELSKPSRAYKEAVNELVQDMAPADMAAFIDELFEALNSTEADTLTDLMNLKAISILELARRVLKGKRVNSFTTDFIEKFVKALI